MKRVRATEVGYDNIAVREVGDVFEVADDFNAPWVQDVDAPVVAKQTQGQTQSATTLAGIQKENAGANDLI